jgi:DnaK suppressor protein
VIEPPADSVDSDLTEAQIAEFREELERQLAKLEKSMTVTDEALKTVELDQGAVGRLSRMDSLQNQSMAKGLRERESVRLALIQQALLRLDAGTYGVCTACGGGVAAERLFVFPESGTCARCGD